MNLECSCGCDEFNKEEDFFTCENCLKEQLHETHKIICKWCQDEICDLCIDDHYVYCFEKRRYSVQLLIDRWRYLWYHKYDENGISKFCKFSLNNFI